MAASLYRHSVVSRRGRQVEASAITAVAPVLILLPFCLLALFAIWLLVRLVWDVDYRWFALGYLAAAVILFIRPVQATILTPLFGARRPTRRELDVLRPPWEAVTQSNHLPADRYVLRVLPSDELNAFACGGHLVVVTTFAIEQLPPKELAGVLAHELSHHLGLHTVALTIEHWLSLPVVLLARIGFWLHHVATAATDVFARSAASTIFGQLVAGVLKVVSLPFLVGLTAANALSNLVAHGAEYQADQRVVRMGYGRNLLAALRRVLAMGTVSRPRGWRERLAASHPPARTRMARLAALLRHPAADIRGRVPR